MHESVLEHRIEISFFLCANIYKPVWLRLLFKLACKERLQFDPQTWQLNMYITIADANCYNTPPYIPEILTFPKFLQIL